MPLNKNLTKINKGVYTYNELCTVSGYSYGYLRNKKKELEKIGVYISKEVQAKYEYDRFIIDVTIEDIKNSKYFKTIIDQGNCVADINAIELIDSTTSTRGLLAGIKDYNNGLDTVNSFLLKIFNFGISITDPSDYYLVYNLVCQPKCFVDPSHQTILKIVDDFLKSDKRIMVMNGAAGTGKSYIINNVIKARYGNKLHYTSTTNASASIISGVTIDRVMKTKIYKTGMTGFKMKLDKPIVIDEMTMAHPESILKHINSNKIIFVGDVNQFSSVMNDVTSYVNLELFFKINTTIMLTKSRRFIGNVLGKKANIIMNSNLTKLQKKKELLKLVEPKKINFIKYQKVGFSETYLKDRMFDSLGNTLVFEVNQIKPITIYKVGRYIGMENDEVLLTKDYEKILKGSIIKLNSSYIKEYGENTYYNTNVLPLYRTQGLEFENGEVVLHESAFNENTTFGLNQLYVGITRFKNKPELYYASIEIKDIVKESDVDIDYISSKLDADYIDYIIDTIINSRGGYDPTYTYYHEIMENVWKIVKSKIPYEKFVLKWIELGLNPTGWDSVSSLYNKMSKSNNKITYNMKDVSRVQKKNINNKITIQNNLKTLKYGDAFNPKRAVYDVESFPNYFSIKIKSIEGKTLLFYENQIDEDTRMKFLKILDEYVLYGINSTMYDEPMVVKWFEGLTPEELNKMSTTIISSNVKCSTQFSFNILHLYQKTVFNNGAFIATRDSGLKSFQAKTGLNIKECSVGFDEKITKNNIKEVREYLDSDIDSTIEYLKSLLSSPEFKLLKILYQNVLDQNYKEHSTTRMFGDLINPKFNAEAEKKRLLTLRDDLSRIGISEPNILTRMSMESQEVILNNKFKITFNLGGITDYTNVDLKDTFILHYDAKSMYPTCLIEWNIIDIFQNADVYRDLYNKTNNPLYKEDRLSNKLAINIITGALMMSGSDYNHPMNPCHSAWARHMLIAITQEYIYQLNKGLLQKGFVIIKNKTDGIYIVEQNALEGKPNKYKDKDKMIKDVETIINPIGKRWRQTMKLEEVLTELYIKDKANVYAIAEDGTKSTIGSLYNRYANVPQVVYNKFNDRDVKITDWFVVKQKLYDENGELINGQEVNRYYYSENGFTAYRQPNKNGTKLVKVLEGVKTHNEAITELPKDLDTKRIEKLIEEINVKRKGKKKNGKN